VSLLLAYYGDDFTGSTDVMEQLVRGGVPTVLFVDPPKAETLARYPHVRAVGVAGQSRAMSPDQMDAALPPAFAALAELAPRFVHVKVSSTFDSSPRVGSIGRTIDIGARVFANRITPLVVGAPSLARYCVFGNLFARSGLDSPLFRLDRHPTMSRHPVTPMDEADIRRHLSRQTDRPIMLVDALTVERGVEACHERLAHAETGAVALFDVLTDQHLGAIGRVLEQLQSREGKPLFVVGSSGVDAALATVWQASGDARENLAPKSAGPVDRILVASGSCSPVTARQVAWAVEQGFAAIPFDFSRLRGSKNYAGELSAIAKRVVTEHDAGRSVIVHAPATVPAGSGGDLSGATLGEMLGRIMLEVLQAAAVPRVAFAGGDTSSQAARALGIKSLEMVGPLAPGAPLCRACSRFAGVDGVECTFKGGQVGHDDFFSDVLSGGARDDSRRSD
jgi:3-oxoisoapionate kinase